MDAERAHQRKLKAISDAAIAKKKHPLPPRLQPPSAPLPGGQAQGPGTSRSPPFPIPTSFGPVAEGRMDAVSNSVAPFALREDESRVIAEIDRQERLAAARRLQDLEDLQKELTEDDEVDAAIERQRHQLGHAAKERLVAAEAAHLKRLQELRVATGARKRQDPLLGA